ncbi:MAG: hypothetical protein IJ840_03760 [Bacteroidales bacterium]|nr:hypothetical protein [Bacteroidales bacterium]
MKGRDTLVLAAMVLLVLSCGTQRKVSRIRQENAQATLALGMDTSFVPKIQNKKVTRDTLKVKDDDGREILIMKAVKDNASGEMVATEQLDAAVVTARFRNIAERHNKIDLAFQVIVPASMQDSKWQLRFYPDMYLLGDSIRLDPVIITGNAYRKAQLKGYQQYNRFLSRIIADTTRFINLRDLEIFLRRNIPQIYAFKTDSSYVSDETFLSMYGVSEREAVDHYTNKIAKRLNERRKSRIDMMYRKYVKVPIVSEGIRLDTVMVGSNGDFIYNYVQTINARPRLRKVDVVLSGEIYESDKAIYDIPRSEPLTFYISSVSSLADNTERYLTKVIERQAEANTTSRIDFKVGKSDIDPSLSDNARELARIKGILSSLLTNKVFDLDSIVVTSSASPEGKAELNKRLSQARSESISKYFGSRIKTLQDSIAAEAGFSIDESGHTRHQKRVDIAFISKNVGENWDLLDILVDEDTLLTEGDKSNYDMLKRIGDTDAREYLMRKESFYPYVKDVIYPRLRTVSFDFHMHRKDMVKDTVHTTMPDSTYMRGVAALKNMDYDGAVALLGPYGDFNAALAYIGLDRDQSALSILSKLEKTPSVNYLMAILYSRTGETEKAVDSYLKACRQDNAYVHRGNLDPEISTLIKTYGLNKEEEEDDLL